MEKKVVFSFLGVSNYKSIKYEWSSEGKDKTSKETCFVQEAFIDIFDGDQLSFKILATQEAKKKNWEGENGLENILIKRNVPYDLIEIPVGKNQRENWSIFHKIVDSVDENIFIFDITHAFRSMPFLVISAINYLRYTKTLEVKHIFYGAFEARENNHIAPIFDLSFFLAMSDWTYSCKQFLVSGRSNDMASMISNAISPKGDLQKLEKLKAPGPEQTLNKLQKNLKKFSEAIMVVRADESIKYGLKIKENLSQLYLYDLTSIIEAKPFFEILQKVHVLFSSFSGDDKNTYKDVNVLAKICIEFDLLQQALTLLNENVVTMIIETSLVDRDKNKREDRKLVSDALHQVASGKSVENKNINNLLKGRNNIEALAKMKRNLSDIRNSVNHAGYNDSPTKYDTIKKSCSEFLEKMQEIEDVWSN